MIDPTAKTPQDMAALLDISPSTLRRWSDEFALYLSEDASSPQGKSHRRYTEADVRVLLRVKDFMDDGMTYEQVRQRLEQQPEEAESTSTALATPEDLSNTMMTYFTESIENLHKGQLSVLNSQAANRELMGVLIQDNFNLKEEGNRLRERMLDLERELSQSKREESHRLESMRQEIESKLMEVRQQASTPSPITVLQSRSGCLGSLFGGGGQVKTVSAPPSQMPPTSSGPQIPPRQPPRPPGPPE